MTPTTDLHPSAPASTRAPRALALCMLGVFTLIAVTAAGCEFTKATPKARATQVQPAAPDPCVRPYGPGHQQPSAQPSSPATPGPVVLTALPRLANLDLACWGLHLKRTPYDTHAQYRYTTYDTWYTDPTVTTVTRSVIRIGKGTTTTVLNQPLQNPPPWSIPLPTLDFTTVQPTRDDYPGGLALPEPLPTTPEALFAALRQLYPNNLTGPLIFHTLADASRQQLPGIETRQSMVAVLATLPGVVFRPPPTATITLVEGTSTYAFGLDPDTGEMLTYLETNGSPASSNYFVNVIQRVRTQLLLFD